MSLFKDRSQAGRLLSEKLRHYQNKDAVVLGLPRGGVVVAAEIAKALHLPLDLVVARKIGAPGNPELAIGAVTEEGECFFDQAFIEGYQVDPDVLRQEIKQEKKEAHRRRLLYRAGRASLNLKNKIVILVDDGIATGFTLQAAIACVKTKNPKKIVVAIPVGPKETLKKFQHQVDEVVVLQTPEIFRAVGEFYINFDQVSDEEVIALFKLFFPN